MVAGFTLWLLFLHEADYRYPPASDQYRWPEDRWIERRQKELDKQECWLRRELNHCATDEALAVRLGHNLEATLEAQHYYNQMHGLRSHDVADSQKRKWMREMRLISGEARYWQGWLP